MAKPINISAATIAAKLLESDLTFTTRLDTSDRHTGLSIRASSKDPRGSTDIEAVLVVNWGVEIEARSWGIKDISFHVSSLTLSGRVRYDDAEGDWIEPGEPFEYAYPTETKAARPAAGAPGADVDAPTTANVHQLADPDWEVTWKTDEYRARGDGELRTSFWPEAEVDLDKRTIEITF